MKINKNEKIDLDYAEKIKGFYSNRNVGVYMLTLTKRQHSVGFSAMNADELFFINGGSGSGYNCYMGSGRYSGSPSTTKNGIPNMNLPSGKNEQKNGFSLTDKGITYTHGNNSVGVKINIGDKTGTISFEHKF